jgi:hypothetical protein
MGTKAARIFVLQNHGEFRDIVSAVGERILPTWCSCVNGSDGLTFKEKIQLEFRSPLTKCDRTPLDSINVRTIVPYDGLPVRRDRTPLGSVDIRPGRNAR